LAAAAVTAGYDRIVAAGGDGTVNEVVNGLLGSQRPGCPFGVIPIGSGNDFAFAADLPLGSLEAAIQRLFAGKPTPIDLAEINDNRGRRQYVTNAVGIGFDAAVAIEAEKVVRLQGFAGYLLATMRTLGARFRRPGFALRFDDTHVRQRGLMLTVGIGPRTGGGFHITPNARHDDGWLDSCLVAPVGRLTILALLPRVMRGTHISSGHIALYRSRVVDLKADEPLSIHTDGEIYAYPANGVTQLSVTSLPGALRLLR
jgi:YegS/Rv2252/BmrU family lipid kinase